MKTRLFLVLSMGLMTFLAPSCKKEQAPTASINVMAGSLNKSGDISGNGGSITKTFKFNNPNTTAGWDMSINAKTGSFQMIIQDAAGVTVVDKTLTATNVAQAADGTSTAGTAGEWTVIVNLTNFNGTGDYSFL